ncbi:MAG TPA: flagellar filament capping protein FliD, partial [bacterium]|nr:flagellar filament capping protein FliD [bacterium]
MGISIGGLSGLDTEKIITQLMELEQIPIKKVQQRIDRYTLQKNTFETFNLKLLSLKSSAETLLDSATWQTKNVTVSDSTKISATASSSASQGTLKFNVTQLGKSESIYSGGAVGAAGESSDTLITNFATASSGVLKIDIDGTETSITYDVNTDTINTLISKINQSSANVTAFYDKNTDKFYITSNTAGNKTITITDDSGGNMAELLKLRAADSPVVENGTSTQFYINDMAQMFTTDTNSYTVNGVTVNFLNTGSTTVVVKNDSSAIVEKIKDFVNKYNDVQDFIKEQTKLTTASTTSDKTTDV